MTRETDAKKRPFLGFGKRSRTFSLEAENIDQASQWLVDSLEEAGAEKLERTRMRLLLEEALINWAEHNGAEQEVTATVERKQSRYRLRIVAPGTKFNPLKPREDAVEEASNISLFSVIDMSVHYSYSMGSNVLRMSMPRPSLNPALRIAIAILVGCIVGVAGNLFFPGDVQESISHAVLQPLNDMWVRLLQALSGPVIFLAALMATFDMGRIVSFGGSRISSIVRYFVISALVVLFTMACVFTFYTPVVAATQADGNLVSSVLDTILKIVPENLVDPFISANTPQLLLIAIVTGYLLASLDAGLSQLKALVQQLNTIGLTVAQHACNFVPLFVGLLLCLKIWTHDIDLLGSIWLPLVISIVISALVLLAIILLTSVRLHVGPLLLMQKLKGPFVKALKRGSIDYSSADELAVSCNSLLGVDSDYAHAVLPQGLILYTPTSAVGLFIFVMFAAEMQGVHIDQLWLLSAAALSVVLAVATPPLTGANLLSFIMAFSYLGISSNVILDVMVFDILFGVLCVAFDQAALQLDTIWQSKRMGLLDETVLRAPLASRAC